MQNSCIGSFSPQEFHFNRNEMFISQYLKCLIFTNVILVISLVFHKFEVHTKKC